ncbi:PAS domain S-box protein [Chondromyces crocatus]|uniref:Anti-anti-sigma factor n=1 Tax=Chondromyces crocatus TaxID=52 RepID=A0A0K1EBJ6_CHOCO|nr:PAS domain S-box protein [Chondromyces crocatus]AKT38219.1 uncharacterized protein CMC5_023620 [Chondromyces crocatus]
MKQRYELLFEHTRDVILITTPDGRIVETNDAALRTYGFTREEMLTRSTRDLRVPAASAEVAAQLASARTTGVLFETLHQRKDGTRFPVEISSRSARLDGQDLLVGVVRDITDRKRAEAEHDALLAQLEARVEERTAALAQANTELAAQLSEISSARDLINKQAEEILALATPVIQLWESILVAPIVGELEPQRMEDLSERLLAHIANTGASTVLLDITGAVTLDEDAAHHLTRLVTATRLLGATAILTGMRPGIARDLVALGIDLADIPTCATLAAGLREAFASRGLRVTRLSR